MMQSSPSLREISPTTESPELVADIVDEQSTEDTANLWVSRITGAIGAVFLPLALTIWAARPGHYRLVLACLIIAMLAAILHSYTFDDL